MDFLDLLPLLATLLAIFITGLALYFGWPTKSNRWNTKMVINKKNKWNWIIIFAFFSAILLLLLLTIKK